MNIRTKLILRFTLIVATILAVFSLAIYLASEEYRREEFYTRLEGRALTTARLLVTVQEIDLNLLSIIDKNSIHALYAEKVLAFDPDNKLIYNSIDDLEIPHSTDIITEVRQKGILRYTLDSVEHVGITYGDKNAQFVILSSAVDRYGRSKLNNLKNILIAGLIVGIAITLIAGGIFTRIILRPIAAMNQDIMAISAGNLTRRIDEGNRKDEIARLAMNFNDMLDRLENAFGIQQQFVSNASHELRTPLAAMTSQLQLTLEKKRSTEEYELVLRSLLDDTKTLVALSNGLLTLAQSEIEKQRLQFSPLRLDEVLFTAQEELHASQPGYHFIVEYESFPEEDSLLTITGNEHLIKTAFLNLMDNACKFSTDHTVRIRLQADTSAITIAFIDKGIGIPEQDLPHVFTPFFRSNNAQAFTRGYGIGLSLCERIIRLHNGTIKLESTLGKGTRLIVSFLQE